MPKQPLIAASFARLAFNEPVRFASEACLIVRRPGASCSACRDACPAAALSGTEWSISIEPDRCVGCGLCAAECSTGALEVDGCTPILSAGERTLLECRRVAPADRDPDATAVACLGGLTTVDLLDAIAASPARSVIVIDRGWCQECAVAQCSAPWQAAVNEADSLLNSVDPSLGGKLIVETRPLPADHAQAIVASLRPDKQVGRRDFLRRFAGIAKKPASREESRRIVFGRGHATPIKRERILKTLSVLARDRQTALPPALLPLIKVAEECELTGICAAICPTGALRLESSADRTELHFDSTRCISCGLCERSCANKAISFWPEGRDNGGKVIVASKPTAACPSCGDTFAGTASGPFCPSCTKSMAVMQELSAMRPRAPAVLADPMPEGAGEEA